MIVLTSCVALVLNISANEKIKKHMEESVA